MRCVSCSSSFCSVLVGFALTLVSVPVSAQCPATSLQRPSSGFSSTSATAFYDSSACSRLQGDHATGWFSLHHCGTISPTVITARDRYDVVGVPAGMPVAVTMRVLIAGWTYAEGCGGTGCCGRLSVTLLSAADSVFAHFYGQTFGGRADFAGAVELPVVFEAGVPRDLEIRLYASRCAGGAHTVDASARLVFDGADEQALVVSCKGFGPTAVPARRPSWGELKTLYR